MMIASPLATLTHRFTRRHPGATLLAEAAFTPDEVVGKVRQGVCELGLVGTPAQLSALGIDVLLLEQQPFVLVGRAGLPRTTPTWRPRACWWTPCRPSSSSCPVVVASNLNVDILSDLGSALAGSLGLAASAVQPGAPLPEHVRAGARVGA